MGLKMLCRKSSVLYACQQHVTVAASSFPGSFMCIDRVTSRIFMNIKHFSSYNGNPLHSKLPIVHHKDYVCYLPPNHRFPMQKFTKVLNFLLKDGVITANQVSEPDLPSKETVTCVHSKTYIDKFFDGGTDTKEQRVTGFKWSEGLVRRCRLETGNCVVLLMGTILAADIALSRGLACSTAGGTHHAFPDYGSGFCLLNDLAVAAKQMILQKKAQKVLIIDLDVHQGDGTAFIFQNDPCVFTLSVHNGKNFPLTKQQSDLDVSLEDKIEDQEYLRVVKDHVPWVLDTFRPDLVLYDAGVDPHIDDDLGRLSLTDQGLFARDFWVLDYIASKGYPCAAVIGGGYSRNLDALALRHTILHRAATKVWQERGL
ncbi:LOW QUALITY PROTEIN: uncharacterized protein SYNPCC7002_A1628-like [Amphiura filiformis]|uniref:LOW QUALITY PROTEIN: uncharacterized protein SYNPCC7002_A1628-like n=1 Tax=Amphiura filiformis TaxID=82378 RepID=UPI003B221FFE